MKPARGLIRFYAIVGLMGSLLAMSSARGDDKPLDQPTANERNGDFAAEHFPMEYPHPNNPWGNQTPWLNRDRTPNPQGGQCRHSGHCDVLPRTCGPGFHTASPPSRENEVSWAKGYREALEGEHLLEPINVLRARSPDQPGYLNPNHPARVACSQFRGDAHRLECCQEGFRKGQARLWKNKLRQFGHQPPSPELTKQDMLCRKEMNYGREIGRTYCTARANHTGDNQCPCVSEFIRYLGCFSLGFYLEAQACSSDLQQILQSRSINQRTIRQLDEAAAAAARAESAAGTAIDGGGPSE